LCQVDLTYAHPSFPYPTSAILECILYCEVYHSINLLCKSRHGLNDLRQAKTDQTRLSKAGDISICTYLKMLN